jgi:hypothetical protein
LVDALASGVSDRKVVEVRVLSWAPPLKSFLWKRGGAKLDIPFIVSISVARSYRARDPARPFGATRSCGEF